MSNTQSSKGFSAVEVVIALFIVAVLAVGGRFIWHRTHEPKPSSGSNNTTQQKGTTGKSQASDPTEGGKYLVITEWGVRVALPDELRGKIAYSIQDATDPDTGSPLQGADTFVAADVLPSSICTVVSSSVGDSIKAGAIYIRSDTSKPFNASRYRGHFQENILSDGGHAYHLNYVTPDCAGGGANATKIEELQAALALLQKIE